jgi:hypothetical protein
VVGSASVFPQGHRMILIEKPCPLISIGRGFFLLVAYFASASGLIRPVPTGGCWPLSIRSFTEWSLLILATGPF